ncbi:MAG: Glutamyl-tRNA(Gln) amidotransferase subunit C [Parcubacteria group bacterium ADurb.Bin247]|jgi:aspartyl/glutamyl-tRNA(Asn/Gln) amidotransferase C subunit|nr:MAG: Glutamyl-tRNA(Gln) amidotransferase subunit C [Parcubacteria group bacterium ADurb.Bin247]HQB85254.1 Asp-tRNA(Asn)/Glu-tRNA(Gln) amidotransferase subunit GatC [Candidatus Pacearchaeota archaeon]
MIKKLSNLARISLSPEEESDLKKDIEKVLDYVNSLKEANISSKQQDYFQSELSNIFRQDIVVEFDDKDAIIKSFNDKEERFLKVKAIL